MEQLQLSVAELHKHRVDAMLGQGHLVTHCGPQYVSIQRCGLLQVWDSDGDVVQPPQLPSGDVLMEGSCGGMCSQQCVTETSGQAYN